MNWKKTICWFVLLAAHFNCLSQDDSINNVLKNLPDDTNKIHQILDITNNIYVANTKLAEELTKSALNLSEKLGFDYGIAEACGWLSYFMQNKGISMDALPYELKALKIREKNNDQKGISTSLNNIGYIYESVGNTDKALEHYEKCLAIREKLNDDVALANILNNLGYIYDAKFEKEKALFYYTRSLNILEKTGDKKGLARQYHNIAALYGDKGKYEKAIEFSYKASELSKQLNDDEGYVSHQTSLVSFYIKTGRIYQAKTLSRELFELAKNQGYLNHASRIALLIHDLNIEGKDYKTALEYYKYYSRAKDSLARSSKVQQFAEMEAKYQNDKKQLEIDNLNKSNELAKLEIISKENEILRRQWELFGSLALLIIFIVFSGYIYKSLRDKKKANEIITKQNLEVTTQKLEIEKQKREIEHKNKEIGDSISYAKNIQQAVLPSIQLCDLVEESLLIYMPKDIVSGDFYWFEKRDNHVYLAVADCTGHGVPGGFMSMIGTILLNEIFNNERLVKPEKILDRLSELVRVSLSSKNKPIRDGMDISFCVLNTVSGELWWAGANNPLWIIGKNEDGAVFASEIKPTKQPIGYFENHKPFVGNYHKLAKGDAVYLFSDGYADQFGGPKGKKLKYKPFQDILIENNSKTLEDIRKELLQYFENWRYPKERKSGYEQVDDICIIGFRYI